MQSSELKSRLSKTVEFLKSDLNQVRTGRATPALLEDLVVDAYGSKMTLKELGSIVVSDSQTIFVTPWDKSLSPVIAKAIRESDLKFVPVEDSGRLRINIPPLNEERRLELVKLVSTKVEESKIAMRDIRQEAMKDIDKDFAAKTIGEDEKFSSKEEVEKIVKDFVTQLTDLGEDKKEDLLKI